MGNTLKATYNLDTCKKFASSRYPHHLMRGTIAHLLFHNS